MIVDSEKHPERNIYFIGAKQLELLRSRKNSEHDINDLFSTYNKKNRIKISFDYYLLGLDWLYLLGLIDSNENGNIVYVPR